jgi:acyl carrier protein
MEQKFINLFAESLDMNPQEIQLLDHFREYENWDSLSHLSLIVMLDENFNVQLETNDLKAIITVNDLIQAIKIRS